jgi:hypothetical protein
MQFKRLNETIQSSICPIETDDDDDDKRTPSLVPMME